MILISWLILDIWIDLFNNWDPWSKLKNKESKCTLPASKTLEIENQMPYKKNDWSIA